MTLKIFKKLILCTILLCAFASVHAKKTISGKPDIEVQPSEVVAKIMDNIEGRRFGWRYQKACTYYGALIFADAVNDQSITKRIEAGYEPFLTGRRKPHKGHVDYNVFGIWPLEMYRQTQKEEYLKTGLWLADLEWENPREDGLTNLTRFWVDDMYMVGSLQVQAYKATGDKKYIDRAALQLKVYCDELQKPNGMFHHRADAPFYWGRGNGWAAAALTEVMLVLPEDHKYYRDLLFAFQKMMKTIAIYQGQDGMWHQLIDDETTFAESSCTGMFLYGLASAIDNGWLPYDEYIDQVEAAWNALSGYVNEKGETREVCVGTNAKSRRKHYLTRPRSDGNFHGQAAVLWAATAMAKLQDK